MRRHGGAARSAIVATVAVVVTVAVAVGAILLAFAGCGKSGSLGPNLPPETVLFVSGPVDTVSHVVELHWIGSDPDGEVESFEFKWIYEPGQEPANYDSTVWFATESLDSTFAVHTPAGYSMPTFVIRAIDNQATPDPTPVRQSFQFRNDPPTVAIVGSPRLPAVTLPVVTVRWSASDPDGNITRAKYLVWLDGDEDGATVVTSGTEYTLPPALFADGAGGYLTGPHTVSVRAVDEGGMASAPDTASWVVRAPEGEVLLVDDLPEAQSAAADPAYRAALDRQLGPNPGTHTILDLETQNPFRSTADVLHTFRFFRSVVWYQEINIVRSPNLALAEDAIRAQLAAGGNVYISSVTLVGTNAALPGADFLSEIVGADSVRTNTRIATTNFSIGNGRILHPGPVAPYDSLRAAAIATNVDALVLRAMDDAAFVARPVVLDSSQTEDWSVGVDRVPAGGSGRFVFLAFPLRTLGGTPAGAPSPAPDANYAEKTIRRILYRFGHGAAP